MAQSEAPNEEKKSDDSTSNAIVIDNGTGTVKAGFAGKNKPSCLIPTLIGQKRQSSLFDGMDTKQYIGPEAKAKAGILNVKYPMEYGKIKNWDDMVSSTSIHLHSIVNIVPSQPNIYKTK